MDLLEFAETQIPGKCARHRAAASCERPLDCVDPSRAAGVLCSRSTQQSAPDALDTNALAPNWRAASVRWPARGVCPPQARRRLAASEQLQVTTLGLADTRKPRLWSLSLAFQSHRSRAQQVESSGGLERVRMQTDANWRRLLSSARLSAGRASSKRRPLTSAPLVIGVVRGPKVATDSASRRRKKPVRPLEGMN